MDREYVARLLLGDRLEPPTEEQGVEQNQCAREWGLEGEDESDLCASLDSAPVLLLGRPSARLTAAARWMRARGRDVYEVGTPLEAIAVLEEARGRFSTLFVIGPIAGAPSVLVANALAEVFPELQAVHS